MKRSLNRLSRRYASALRKHLKPGPQPSLQPARGLGRQAVSLGLETLNTARIHERALATLGASASRDGLMKRAEMFFAETLSPIKEPHRAALTASARLNRLSDPLGRRTAASNRSLKPGIIQRQMAEKKLRKNGKHCAKLLRESHHLQKPWRHPTHRILSAREAERTKISREPQDEFAPTWLGSIVRLLTLKKLTAVNANGLEKEIASTQRRVEDSVQSVNRFARELDTQPQA